VYYKKDVAPDYRSERKRRAVNPTLIRCRLALVADYRFYQEMGQNDLRKSINYMIGVADRVDAIYRSTDWSSEYTGYGFEIAKVIVHKESHPSSANHYNKLLPKDPWLIKDLLRV